MEYKLNVNGTARTAEADSDTPLLYVLRDNLDCKDPNMAVAWASAALARC